MQATGVGWIAQIVPSQCFAKDPGRRSDGVPTFSVGHGTADRSPEAPGVGCRLQRWLRRAVPADAAATNSVPVSSLREHTLER